jgi:hypothetical protein
VPQSEGYSARWNAIPDGLQLDQFVVAMGFGAARDALRFDIAKSRPVKSTQLRENHT